MTSRRTFALVALTALLLPLAAAAQPAKPYAGTTLRVAVLHDRPTEAMKPFLARFKEETGIEVVLEQMANQALFQKATVESTAKTGYFDIMRLGPNFMATFAKPGWIVPLDDYIKKSGFDMADYVPAAVDSLSKVPGDNRIWGLPQVMNTGMLAYRTDLFGDPKEKAAFKAKYGYDLRPPTTTKEWLDAAEFFTRDTDGDGRIDLYGYGVGQKTGGPDFDNALTPIWTFGGEVIDDRSKKVLFNSPATVAALERMKKLQAFQPQASLTWEMYDNIGPMQDGRLAMTAQLFSFVDVVLDPAKSKMAKNVAYTTIPVHPGNGRGYTTGKFISGGGGFAIHAHSKNKEAAWTFLNWMFGRERAKEYAIAGALTPRRSVLESKEVLDSKPAFKAVLPVYLESLDKVAKDRPALPESNAILRQVGQAWHQVALGQKSAAESAADAQGRIEKILRDAGYDMPK